MFDLNISVVLDKLNCFCRKIREEQLEIADILKILKMEITPMQKLDLICEKLFHIIPNVDILFLNKFDETGGSSLVIQKGWQSTLPSIYKNLYVFPLVENSRIIGNVALGNSVLNISNLDHFKDVLMILARLIAQI